MINQIPYIAGDNIVIWVAVLACKCGLCRYRRIVFAKRANFVDEAYDIFLPCNLQLIGLTLFAFIFHFAISQTGNDTKSQQQMLHATRQF